MCIELRMRTGRIKAFYRHWSAYLCFYCCCWPKLPTQAQRVDFSELLASVWCWWMKILHSDSGWMRRRNLPSSERKSSWQSAPTRLQKSVGKFSVSPSNSSNFAFNIFSRKRRNSLNLSIFRLPDLESVAISGSPKSPRVLMKLILLERSRALTYFWLATMSSFHSHTFWFHLRVQSVQ